MIKKKINIFLISLLVLLIGLQVYVVNVFKSIPGRVEVIFMEEDVGQEVFSCNTISSNKDFLISHVKDRVIKLDNNETSLLLTDESYTFFADFNLAKGRWFSRNQNQAVISNELSKDLFGTEDVLGKEIHLEGNSYIISGVYEEKGLLKTISNRRETIYVPLNSSLDNDSKMVNRLLVTDIDGKVPHFLAEKFIDQFLLNTLPKDYQGYRVKDMTKKADVISQFLTGYIFIMELLILIFICNMFVLDFKTCINNYKRSIEKHYIGEIISRNMTDILMIGIKWSVMVLIGILLLREIISFQFYVPGKYLPPDYIFDFNFYYHIFSQKLGSSSSLVSDYEGLYKTVFSYALVILIFKIILSLLLYLSVVKKIFNRGKQSLELKEEKLEVESGLS